MRKVLDSARDEHCEPPRPGPAEPPRTIPDRIAPEALAPLLGVRIAGTPASVGAPEGGRDARAVVWVDCGDEVIVHLDSIKTAVASDVLLIAIDLESDDTGRQTLVVPIAPGTRADDELTLVTEDVPRGHAEIAARWGRILQDAIFAAIEDMARTHADERQAAAKALVIADGALAFRAEGAV
ncbi:MAG: hypothetical protein E6J90_45200 [Deltaproteobacteria bacterium]|nr:MAG: hypothetical protein E6J90_45200 [Deltaproteobacteria bacterium]TMQ12294.1 MAG: hypothetical protein E6J91_21090 [Deltaproteobacteria bacterium]